MDLRLNHFLMIKIVFIILSSLLIQSCVHNYGDYLHHGKRHYIFGESYNLNDTISVGDYQIYTSVWKDHDSLYNHFSEALINTEIPILFSDSSKNVHINDFRDNRYLYARKIDDTKIKEQAGACLNCTNLVMVPIISIRYEAVNYASGAGSNILYSCRITLSIRLVKDNEIVYFKQMRIVEYGDRDNYRNYNFPIPQEKWDGLLREVMKEYIERLEWRG